MVLPMIEQSQNVIFCSSGFTCSFLLFLLNFWQVVLFGSFTEDETRSLLKSPEKTKKPVEKKELPVVSSNVATELVFGGFSGEAPHQFDYSRGPIGSQPSHVNKDIEGSSIVTKHALFPAASGSSKENGVVKNLAHYHPISNGNEESRKEDSVDLIPLHLSDEHAPPNQSRFSKLEALDGGFLREVKSNGSNDSNLSATVPFEEVTKNASNGHVAVRDFLPRGLINSGNLCFLNATLQALLSCSPFVQLLQGLKSRNIPKASPLV